MAQVAGLDEKALKAAFHIYRHQHSLLFADLGKGEPRTDIDGDMKSLIRLDESLR
jgi:hypothetical protein